MGNIWNFSEEKLQEVWMDVPNIDSLRSRILNIHPDTIATLVDPKTSVPEAAICLHDVGNDLTEIIHALKNVYGYLEYYGSKGPNPNRHVAVFFAKFYADDAALRYYAAREHLAEAIVFMLDIDEADLKPFVHQYEGKGPAVGKFLRKEFPAHPITESVQALASSPDYDKAQNSVNEKGLPVTH